MVLWHENNGSGRSARDRLKGKSLYAHTVFGAGDDGWIWMNLAQLEDSPNTKPSQLELLVNCHLR